MSLHSIFYFFLFLLNGCLSAPSKVVAEEALIKVPANSQKGFNYDYYLYLPIGVEKESQPVLMVEPNNTGKATDDMAVHDEAAKKIIQKGYFKRISDRLRFPMLIPVFPRAGDSQPYIHYLNRQTMKINSGLMKRVDLQLIAMIEDARKILAERNIKIKNKIFMNGFSSSGSFSLRFTALHPYLIQAVSAGGINALPILPLKKYQGQKLPYPIGVDDFKEISGEEFDLKTYLKVPQKIYMGQLDTNDTVPFRDSWDEKEADFIKRILDEKMMPERWNKVQQILKGSGANVLLSTYPGVGHAVPPNIEEDIYQFFLTNL